MKKPQLTREDFENVDDIGLTEFIKRYKSNPIKFAEEVCQLTLDEPQKQILLSIKANKYIGIKSGHGIGKSTMTGVLILWWMSTRPDCRVIVTANTATQLRTRTWSSVAEVLNKALNKSWFEYTATKLTFIGAEDTWFTLCNTWSDGNFESYQGIHAESVLMIFDEASSIPAGLFEVAEGAMTTKDCKMVMFGNPTRTAGYFFDKLNNETKWKCITVDSRDSQWTNKVQIKEWADEYGIDSDFFRIRVKGDFPKQASTSLINHSLIDSSIFNGPYKEDRNFVKVLAIDVARTGDSMVLSYRNGLYFKFIYSYQGKPDDIDNEIIKLDEEHHFDFIVVDSTGHGAWFASQFKRYPQLSGKIIQVNFSESAQDSRYNNKRTEMYGRFNDWLKRGGKIPLHIRLIEDLKAQEYTLDSKNRFALIPKDKIKEEIGRSPDDGDSCALSLMVPLDKIDCIQRISLNKSQMLKKFRETYQWQN